jgi:hypothetical protein
MQRLEDPTHVKRFDRFDSIFALFPRRTHLSNLVRSDFSCWGLKSGRCSV